MSIINFLLLFFCQIYGCFNTPLSRRFILTTPFLTMIHDDCNLNNENKLIVNNQKILLNDNEENTALINCIKNNIYFSGPLTDQSIFAITSNIVAMQYRDNTEINLHIQSGGGSLLPSLGLIDLIRTSDIPINTFIDGYVASAATLISIVGAKRLMSKHGAMLIHQLKMSNEYSKYDEIKDYSDNADTLMQIIKELYLEYSNISESKLDYLLGHDLWLNSTTCLDYGFVDITI